MLILALALAAQSVLGTMGDLHESVLHANAGEAYTHQHAPDAHHDGDAQADDHGADEVLHLLEHQSCGGHCTWIADAAVPFSISHRMALALTTAVAQRLLLNDYTAPFRPPIRG